MFNSKLRRLNPYFSVAIQFLTCISFILALTYFGVNIEKILDKLWKVNNTSESKMMETILIYASWFTTAILAWIAWFRIGTIHRDNQSRFMIQIDSRWGSAEIIKARTIMHYIYRNISDNYSNQIIKSELKDICQAVGKDIIKMSESQCKQDRDDFMLLLNLLDFMETIGFLENNGYVSVEQLNALSGSTIKFFYMCFANYICHKRCKHKNEGLDLYKNFEELYGKLPRAKIN